MRMDINFVYRDIMYGKDSTKVQTNSRHGPDRYRCRQQTDSTTLKCTKGRGRSDVECYMHLGTLASMEVGCSDSRQEEWSE